MTSPRIEVVALHADWQFFELKGPPILENMPDEGALSRIEKMG